MKKRILIVYARYGSGHKSIAEHIAKYLEENNNDIIVKLFDLTPYATNIGKIGIKLMDFVAKRRPEFVFDLCYEFMDHKFTSIGHNKLAKKSYDNDKLRNEIKKFNPDITIATHYYGSDIVSYYNDLKITKSKVFLVLTDYKSHEIIMKNHKKTDGFIVANDIVKKELIEYGIDKNKIYPFGLPLNLDKIKEVDTKKNIFTKYNLDKNKPVYLFFGGSTAGSMYYYDYFKYAVKLNLKANIIFVCGHNAKLKEKCDNYIKKHNINNFMITGFTTDVFNLLKISDLVISKAGGATVTECLEMRVPMLIIPGVGGQEKYNARFIAKKRYGYYVRGKHKFQKTLNYLNKHPKAIIRMKNNLSKLDKNNSVVKINNLIKKS